jgi:hypothetical protein
VEAAIRDLAATYGDDEAITIAQLQAYGGADDEAFRWLERAYARRDAGLVGLKSDPLLSRLERDRRWRPLLRKVGLPAD